jgi:type IV pilus assembly protein PilE
VVHAGGQTARLPAPSTQVPKDNRDMLHAFRLRRFRAPHERGFTLVELMIAVGVIGILTALALPSFFESIRKSRRAEAVSRVAQVQQAQERWRANNNIYATLAQLSIPATVTGGRYSVGVSNVSTTGYAVTATALEPDPLCTSLKIESNGPQLIYTSTGSGAPDYCWNR